MNRVRLGSAFRVIRIELRLRQLDVAERAQVSQQTVSRIERGRFGALSIDSLAAVAQALEADLSMSLRWRGSALDRLLDRRHAELQDVMVRELTEAGWEVVVEQSFNHFGERGCVDILAWRADCRALLVIEIKSQLVDLQDTVRTLDMKARVVPAITRRERGWNARTVAAVLVLPDSSVHRRTVDRHAALMAAAYPARTWDVRRWIARPDRNLRGILFLPSTHAGSTKRKPLAFRRVSRRRTRIRTASAAGSGATEA